MKHSRDIPAYAEIGIATNFSFLRGGSHPQEYVQRASKYGLYAIGIADRNTLAGVVRAYSEYGNRERVRYKPKLLVGTRLVFTDGTPDILAYPRKAMRLTELVTPLKPLEAMAQRRLVAASDVGGHRELIRDGDTGTLFAPGDPDAIAAALAGLLADRSGWEARRAAS